MRGARRAARERAAARRRRTRVGRSSGLVSAPITRVMTWSGRGQALMGRASRACAGAASALALVGAAHADARTIYVPLPTANKVLRIDAATGEADTPISTDTPRSVALTPDGRAALIVSQHANALTPLDTATGTLGTPTVLVPDGPVLNQMLGVSVSPDGTTAYVAALDADTVVPVDIASGATGTPIAVPRPAAVGITPDGETAYVTSTSTSAVTPVDLATGTAGTPIMIWAPQTGVAIAPDGSTGYLAAGFGEVRPIDTATNTTKPAIATGGSPLKIAIRPDGRSAYVTRRVGSDVVPIDLASGSVGEPIPLEARGTAITIAPDGMTAYVAVEAPYSALVAIDLTTHRVVKLLDLPGIASDLAIAPNQGPTARLTVIPAPPQSATVLDASRSDDVDGKVVSYRWDFGDGHTATTSQPTVTHVYATAGTYTAAVTVTDDEGCSTELVFTGQTASCNGSARARASVVVTVGAPPSRGSAPAAGTDEDPDTTRPPLAAISNLRVAARCVRPRSSNVVRVGLRLRMRDAGPLRVRVERARGTGGLRRCPAPKPSRHFGGTFKAVKTLPRVATRRAGAPSARRATLRLRLSPGLYRITVRGHRPNGRLTRPLQRYIRVLTPTVLR